MFMSSRLSLSRCTIWLCAGAGLVLGEHVQGAELYDRAGWVADIPPGQHDAQAKVTIVNDHMLQVEHFTYDGTAPVVYFYLGAEDRDMDFLNGLQVNPLLDRPYNDETLLLRLPGGMTLEGYTAISVWCAQFHINFSSASFVAPSMPYARAGWVADIPPGQHDAEAEATIITDRIILVDHLTYDGLGQDVYFYLGASNDDTSFANGLQVPPLLDRAYADETLVLLLPNGATLDGYGALSIWSAVMGTNYSSASFGEVFVPAASNWGMAIMLLMIFTVGTLLLRSGRRVHATATTPDVVIR